MNGWTRFSSTDSVSGLILTARSGSNGWREERKGSPGIARRRGALVLDLHGEALPVVFGGDGVL
jgi:hypothetical protein